MRRRVLLSSVLAFVALASFAALAPTVRAGPDDPPPERWRIQGSPSADSCGGRIVLAARNLRFGARSMFADVVNRRYALRRQGSRRIAEGSFSAPSACNGTRITERWDLEQTSADVLEGTLESTWRLQPGCQPCTVRFNLRATRVRGRTR